MTNDKINIYKTGGGQSAVGSKIENYTNWLTQSEMEELFNQTKQKISFHINNIFKEKELPRFSIVKKSLTVQNYGKWSVK